MGLDAVKTECPKCKKTDIVSPWAVTVKCGVCDFNYYRLTGVEYKPNSQHEPVFGNDMALNPPYYSRFKIEPIDFINQNELDYMQGNVIKYVCRYKHKGQALEDLNKALSYIQKMIKSEEVRCQNGDV